MRAGGACVVGAGDVGVGVTGGGELDGVCVVGTDCWGDETTVGTDDVCGGAAAALACVVVRSLTEWLVWLWRPSVRDEWVAVPISAGRTRADCASVARLVAWRLNETASSGAARCGERGGKPPPIAAPTPIERIKMIP